MYFGIRILLQVAEHASVVGIWKAPLHLNFSMSRIQHTQEAQHGMLREFVECAHYWHPKNAWYLM